MTREEARQICKEVRHRLWILDEQKPIWDKGTVSEALDMAIEALQQEPIIYCKDCKHWHEWENGAGSCHRSSIMWVGTDCYDYCSLAEGR